MKTTVKVSISGIAFTIDEDAYQILNNYLNTLKAHFNSKSDGKEVVEDIEARLAELLLMRVNSPEQVVNIDDAKEVIRIMGSPSDLIGDEQQAGNPDQSQPTPPVTVRKRLYRDPDNRVIAGVCSGLGNYFGIDPVIFRLIFVICAVSIGIFPFIDGYSFFPITIKGFAIWAYIILWIAVPQANTPQQKLEMTGKNPSIDDIEQRVRDGHNKNSDKNDNYHQNSGGGLGKFLGGIIRVFVIFIAGCLLFAGAVALIAIIGSMLGFTYYTGVGLRDILDIVGADSIFIRVLLAIVVIYPLLILIYWGSKLLFRFKLRDKMVMVVAFIIWFFSIVFLGGDIGTTVAGEAGSRRKSVRSVETIDIQTKSDTLFLNLPYMYNQSAENAIGELKTNDDDAPRIWLSEYNGLKTLFIVPTIEVRYSSNVNNFQLELRKKTFGRNKHKAEQNTVKSQFSYTQNDSLLLINPFMFNKNYPLRKAYEAVSIIVYAPVDKKVIVQDPLLPKNPDWNRNRHSWSFDFNSYDDWDDDDF